MSLPTSPPGMPRRPGCSADVKIPGTGAKATPLPAAVPAAYARVDAASWIAAAGSARAGGHRLVALWGADRRANGAGFAVLAAFALSGGLVVLDLEVAANEPAYPDLSPLFP